MATPHHRTDLNQGKVQALQALLNSVSPQSSTEQADPAMLQRLSDKLDHLLGDIDSGVHKNEAGELVNEEGLPIIDISEPLHANEDDSTPNFTEEPFPLPNSLSPAENDVRRRERERILDLLEQEEEEENRRIAEAAEEEKKAEMQKLRDAARKEMEQRKAARDIQKKMGKALVGGSKNKTINKQASDRQPQATQSVSPKPPEPVKRVTFSEPETTSEKAAKSETVPAKSPPAAPPMSMNVVERFPIKTPSLPNKVPEQRGIRQSDIEAKGSVPKPRRISPPGSPTSSGEELLQVDSEGEAELDYATLQREVAQEYFEKRGNLTRDTLEDDLMEYVPEDATLSGSRMAPSVSRFKAEREQSGGYFMPAHSKNAIRRAVRLGKVENDQLVGGEEGESGSEGDEEMKEIIELLSKSEIVNVGPEAPSLNEAEASTKRKGPSKFKVNRSEMGRPPANSPALSSTEPTPISTAARSSPKSPSTPSIGGASEAQLREEVYRFGGISPTGSTPIMPSMVVDSPPFAPPPPAERSNRPSQPPTIMSSSVVESTGAGARFANKREPTRNKKISRFMAERM